MRDSYLVTRSGKLLLEHRRREEAMTMAAGCVIRNGNKPTKRAVLRVGKVGR